MTNKPLKSATEINMDVKFLVSWFKSHALATGCEQIHLDSGVQRFAAHRFYLREGFNIASHHFSIVDVKST